MELSTLSNTLTCTKVLELTSIIRLECFHISPCLVLYKGFELLESTENLILVFQECIDASLEKPSLKVAKSVIHLRTLLTWAHRHLSELGSK